jgi:phosphohistidine phosphatase
MKLYFVRHTSAAHSAVTDAQRPLTAQGEAEARQVGCFLAEKRIRPAHVFSSPLLRAQQTAAIIARELNFPGTTETLKELSNSHTTSSLIKALPATGDEAILVGHMPSLADHVAALLHASDSSQFAFGKGSTACIELEVQFTSSAKMLWFNHLQ